MSGFKDPTNINDFIKLNNLNSKPEKDGIFY
jgi:hypothetical protein